MHKKIVEHVEFSACTEAILAKEHYLKCMKKIQMLISIANNSNYDIHNILVWLVEGPGRGV